MTKCRRCKRPLLPDECVYYDGRNNRTKRPVCQACYEDIVRRQGRRYSRYDKCQYQPGRSQREYNGGMFYSGEW